MRLPPSRRSLVLTLALAAMAAVPCAVSMIHAQVFVCYVEWCVPKGSGESCIVKQVPCPSEA